MWFEHTKNMIFESPIRAKPTESFRFIPPDRSDARDSILSASPTIIAISIADSRGFLTPLILWKEIQSKKYEKLIKRQRKELISTVFSLLENEINT
jgi:hypothetical protein